MLTFWLKITTRATADIRIATEICTSTGLSIDFVYDHIQHRKLDWLGFVGQSYACLFLEIWRRPTPDHEPTRDKGAKLGIVWFDHP